MSLVIHAESRCDHVAPAVVEFVQLRCAYRDGLFIETIALPAELGTPEYVLNGPLRGDTPIMEPEVDYGLRTNATGRRMPRLPNRTRPAIH